MKRTRMVVATVAAMATMAVSSVPALADGKFDDDRRDRIEDRIDERADRIEDFYDEVYDISNTRHPL
jgi:tellurite resistance protein